MKAYKFMIRSSKGKSMLQRLGIVVVIALLCIFGSYVNSEAFFLNFDGTFTYDSFGFASFTDSTDGVSASFNGSVSKSFGGETIADVSGNGTFWTSSAGDPVLSISFNNVQSNSLGFFAYGSAGDTFSVITTDEDGNKTTTEYAFSNKEDGWEGFEDDIEGIVNEVAFVPGNDGGLDGDGYSPEGSEGDGGFAIDNVGLETNSVPEPGTVFLMGSGLFGLMGFRKRA